MSAQATIAAAARGMHHLVPSTFEARGATVPFTTPILAHSRVRKDWRDRFELVVIGFSGGVGDYVLPWKAVADLLSLTAHDTLLHQELQGREALDPHDVRHVALEVAKTGLAGPDVSEAANRAVNVDEEGRTVNEMTLMLGVIEEVEPAETAALAAEVTTTAGQYRIRDTFAALGSRIGPRFNSLERLLPELTRLTYTIGLPNTPAPGRLRRIVQRLEEFRRSVSAWGSERLGVAAEEAGFCAKVSGVRYHHR
jgi:hypothetical protein